MALSPDVIAVINKLIAKQNISIRERRRLLIIRSLCQGNRSYVARKFNHVSRTVSRWCDRAKNLEMLIGELQNPPNETEIRKLLFRTVTDAVRIGAPAKYTPEQQCKIIAMAVRKPCEFGLPIENWTHRELAVIANDKNIAPGISRRTVGRILEECDIKPHKSKYWENPKIDNEKAFRNAINNICYAYRNAPDNLTSGIHTVCIDEKTGIQAIERIFPDIPATPGRYKRLEFEYIRHGTQSLIAGFEVGNGKILKAHVGKTRNEKDFANLLDDTINISPDDQWIFIVDRLNIHMSETLVSLVAKHIRFKGDLGMKQRYGIQKSLASREKFLSNPKNRIHFIYTPKHCSWMNQIEIWFGILNRKALKRASFSSIEELKKCIFYFIDYFNKTMARAFSWTYKGHALKA